MAVRKRKSRGVRGDVTDHNETYRESFRQAKDGIAAAEQEVKSGNCKKALKAFQYSQRAFGEARGQLPFTSSRATRDREMGNLSNRIRRFQSKMGSQCLCGPKSRR